jgi:hypothetical protein
MVQTVDPFRVRVDGNEVEVDHRTFTLAERRASRAAVLKLSDGDDLVPDEADALAALVWVVLRRSQPELDFGDVLESLTLGDLADAEPVQAADLQDRDDDPEA